MTPERWQRVKAVLHDALELAPEQRTEFLDRACASDDSLRREVQSILSAGDEVGSSFLESAATQVMLTEGTRLGDYRLQSLLGSGGMGDVYRARDLRLDRDVAIKVLPSVFSADPDRLRRFEQEARAAAALNHPNILGIFQMGIHGGAPYLVFELLDGQTLREHLKRGPLPFRKAIDYARQIAHGLAAAHDRGIVHRDMKPENLFVTGEGRLKILDFGLAKLRPPQTQETVTERLLDAETEPGAVMGTVGYMSPEQVRGDAADHRSDIFSFGAILFEMLSGERAFRGPSPVETMNDILKKDPSLSGVTPAVPLELQRVMHCCLEKNPERRYRSARDLVFALEGLRASGPAIAMSTAHPAHKRSRLKWVWGAILAASVLLIFTTAVLWKRLPRLPRAPQLHSLAVLPLQNLSGNPDQEYLADGMTEALISNLGKINAFRVISRTSTMQYKNTRKNLPQIASELGVDAVVEGSVLESGERVRITAQLIEARTDRHLWAETYDRNFRDVLALQDDVAFAITKTIQGQVAPRADSSHVPKREVDPDAYRLYLKGTYYWNRRTKEGFETAMDYYRQAIDKDPTNAFPYAALANGYLVLLGYSLASTREQLPKARQAALKALELDDASAEAHECLAHIHSIEWQFAEAEKEYQRALEIDPSSSGTHQGYGTFLTQQGRWNEALFELKRAEELDPLWFMNSVLLGNVYYFQGQYDQAIPQYKKVLDMDPDFWPAHGYLVFTYEEKGMYPEAFAELQKVLKIFPHTNSVAALGELYARWGRTREARNTIRQLQKQSEKEFVSDYWVATIYAALGEKDRAFQLLENAYNERSEWILFLKVDPRFARLRKDPRFADLLRRVGLPQ
jgi:serine/threonine-protein kinase